MIRVFVFDWFGVVCNKVYLEWAKANGADEVTIRKLMILADSVDAGDITLLELRSTAARLVHKSIDQVRDGIAAHVRINEHVIALIGILRKRYQVAVLSNVNAQFLTEILRAHHLEHLFDLVIASSTLRIVKPDEKIFQLVLRMLNCNPAEIVFIDDTIIHVQAAQQLGIKSIVFESAGQLKRVITKLGLL